MVWPQLTQAIPPLFSSGPTNNRWGTKTLDDEDEDNDSDADNNHRRPHHDAVLKTAWSYRFQAEGNDQVDDHLLADLSSSHPEQVQIFRLWQIYLDNVNPLLRVTHTPTLQARIIDAASDVTNITPALEALIFSIYSVSIVSITDDECRNLFQVPRKQLLARYQSACQQALLKCHAWRSGDHDGMVAVYLYLVSLSISYGCCAAYAAVLSWVFAASSDRHTSSAWLY